MQNQESPTRRNFLKVAAAAGLAAAANPSSLGKSPDGALPAAKVSFKSKPIEWRNKVEGMSYRQLGKTGFMVSEIVMGALTKSKLPIAREAIERGVNYFDTAERYRGGGAERTLGELVKDSSIRDRVYLTTKISSYQPTLDNWAEEILSGLPSEKQEATRTRAKERIEELGVMRSGYFFEYFDHQNDGLPTAYLTHQVFADYGHVDGYEKKLRTQLDESLDGCLERLNTDYVDILMAPHGARHIDELENPVLAEFFESAKQSGKARAVGLSIHSDVPQLLVRASEIGIYDVSMCAYNIVNQGTMEMAVREASLNGLGLIAMKVARSLNRVVEGKGVPQWRIDKLNTVMPGEGSVESRAYKWALQNPHLSAVISGMQSIEMLDENLAGVGQKVELGLI